jgi:prepilin-type N-terminal cleavage/methylation domain-containing protein
MRKINRGFTLVELLIVLMIIGILAGMLYLLIGPSDDLAKKKACSANRATILLTLENYRYTKGLGKDYLLQTFIDHNYENTMSTGNGKCPSGGTYSAGTENGNEVVVCSIHSVTPPPPPGTGNYISWTQSFGNPGIPPNSTWPTPIYDSSGTVVTNKKLFEKGTSFSYVNGSGVTEYYVVVNNNGIIFGRNKDAVTPDAAVWGIGEIVKVSSREVVKWSTVTASTPAFTNGDVVYDDTSGKYYIARGTGNLWNAPGSGNWVEIK